MSNLSENDIAEKRKFRRIDANVIINYAILTKNEVEDYKNMSQGMTENIGLGGICFQIREELPPNTIIRLILAPPKLHTRLHVLAKTIWTEKIRDSKLHRIGASFIGLSEQDTKEIESILLEEDGHD